MTTSYGITRVVLDCNTFIKITEEEYQEIATAKQGLVEALSLEEKYDLVLENFCEYEIELLKISTHNTLFDNFSYGQFRNLINRRIANLLSSCRLYLDHSKHHLSKISNGKLKEDFEANTNYEYDTTLSYRAMEALRNYVQHRGYPIQGCSYTSSWVQDKLRYSIMPYLDIDELAEDGNFKATVLKELRDIGQKHDIKPLLREYISGIGSIHEKNRMLLKPFVQEWDKLFESKIKAFELETKNNESIIGLAAVKYEESRGKTSPIHILRRLIERRMELETKNRNLDSLAARYVTSEDTK